MIRHLIPATVLASAYSASIVGICLPVMSLATTLFPDSEGALFEIKAMAITAAVAWALTLVWSWGLLEAHKKAKAAEDTTLSKGIETMPSVVVWFLLAALAVAAIPHGLAVIPAGVLAIPSVPFVVLVHPVSATIFYGATAIFAYGLSRYRRDR